MYDYSRALGLTISLSQEPSHESRTICRSSPRAPEVNQGAAQAWLVAGTIPFIFAGGLHALLALADTARPRYFTPRDRSVKPALEGTRIRFGGNAAPRHRHNMLHRRRGALGMRSGGRAAGRTVPKPEGVSSAPEEIIVWMEVHE